MTKPPTAFYARHARRILLGMLLLLPVIWIGTIGAQRSNSNDPRQWLPRGFEEADLYDWFQASFDNDEILVVSWPGCTLEDPRVDRLAEALRPPEETDVPADRPALFRRVASGPQMLRQLTSPPTQLSRTQALARLAGTFVGPDGQTTCIMLLVSAEGEADRAAAVEKVRQTARTACDLPPDSLRLGGPTVDAAAIDVESQRMRLRLTAFSIAIVFLVAWRRLRSLRLAVIVLLGALYSTMGALAVVFYSGGNMNLVMTMLPPLVYVLSISASVHLVNYYRDALREGDPHSALGRAVAAGWLPCVLASGTTAVGLLSLAVSDITPIRMFGIYSAAGMGISLVVLFLFVPAALQMWPPTTGGNADVSPRDRVRPTELPRGADRAVRLLDRHHALIAGGCLAVLLSAAWGLTRIRATVKLQDRFAADSRILNDYRWLEAHVGPLVPMQVVVRFDRDCPLEVIERTAIVSEIEGNVRRFDVIGATISPATFLPQLPEGSRVRDVARRAVLQRKVEASWQMLIDTHFLAETDAEQLWRIDARANAMNPVDYGRFIEIVRQRVDPIVAAHRGSGVSVVYTGIIPLMYKAQRELLNDLVESFLTAVCVITVVMVVSLRTLSAGLIAMAPNVFPVVVVFGVIGWFGFLVEIGSVNTASLALGIAVDDTFHFVTWFRRGLRQGESRRGAVRFAYQRCAGAMVQTTMIAGLGLVVFSLSSFMPIVRFSWMMVAMLCLALFGDLVFFPALACGPLGKRFRVRRP